MEVHVKALEDSLAVAEAKSVEPVLVKLPIFWPDKADLWFIQAEAQLTSWIPVQGNVPKTTIH